MRIQRGMRDQLGKYLNLQEEFQVQMDVSGGAVYDFCCFGVDRDGKLSDDRYMVFYNQRETPNREISFQQNGKNAQFFIRLSALPESIQKLVFTVSIDGDGTMGDIASHTLSIEQGGKPALEMRLSGSDFKSEKAIISIEIYQKNGWRFGAVASGFNGGLGDLLRSYGGEEMGSSEKPEKVSPPLEQPQKSEKISLKKGQKVSLSKNNGSPILIENGWTAKGKDYDLKALVRYRNGRLIYVGAANRDEVLSTPEGAVCHGGDIKAPGELEHITIKWHPEIASVAVSSYSALENGRGSFRKYGVFVRIKNGNQVIEIPAADASANDRSYTLCFGEILFGTEKDSLEVSALELYSAPTSEHRIGYENGVVKMDIGPVGKLKK